MVMADELPIAALEACPPPRAPSESVFSCGKAEITVNMSTLAIPVEVKDNFSSAGTLEAREIKGNRRMPVNDKSRRFKLGQYARSVFIEASDNAVSRSFSVLRVDSFKSECGSIPTQNLAKFVSVYGEIS
jgi:hypothetical protein